MLTSGALPYSLKQIALASSLAFCATSIGDILVFMWPIHPGSGFGSCNATCCPVGLFIESYPIDDPLIDGNHEKENKTMIKYMWEKVENIPMSIRIPILDM